MEYYTVLIKTRIMSELSALTFRICAIKYYTVLIKTGIMFCIIFTFSKCESKYYTVYTSKNKNYVFELSVLLANVKVSPTQY